MRHHLAALSVLVVALGAVLGMSGCRERGTALARLEEGQTQSGFRLLNLYDAAGGHVVGGRLIHERTGFLVDLLDIQSVPQGFMWVKTLPYSDQGEPHACEHLLLGKGAKGRAVAALEEMTLGSSSAWTSQLNTVYHFNTLAGPEGFYRTLEARLDALLNPDYSDEEIRREVAHVAVSEDAGTGELSLEEKGTVFTEMVSSFEGPSYPLWTGVSEMLYGADHVQANNAGGRPAAMRHMTPKELRRFHQEFYRPSGMGIIASLPDAMSPLEFLERLDGILGRVWTGADASDTPGIHSHALPAPAPAAAPGELRVVPYASENAASPAQALFAWPAALDLDVEEIGLLELFLDTFAGVAGTPLYDALVASETRELETGATSVYGYHSDEPGNPVMIGLAGLNPETLDLDQLAALRELILAKLRTVHDWADGDPALAAFDREAASRLEARRKDARQALDRPPMFGFRQGSAGYWQDLLGLLEREPGFHKSLVLENLYDALARDIDTERNLWRDAIDRWGLLDALPIGLGVRPDPALLLAAEQEKTDRLAAFTAELEARYGQTLPQAALADYKRDFDAATAAIEADAAGDAIPAFVKNPPLTLDDNLDYEELALAGGAPLVASTFENMSSATLGLAFRLDVLPESRLHLLPILPDLLTRTGLTLDGELLGAQAMLERRRRELTSLAAYFDSNMLADRVELVLRVTAGSAELPRVMPWLDATLRHAYLAPENLPRLRDLVDQEFSGLRTRMQGSEESWVQDPASAYRFQDSPLYLSTGSFLTQIEQIYRLKWLLADPGDAADRAALDDFVDALAAAANESRDALAARCSSPPVLANGASDAATALATELLAALGGLLPDLPDDSLPGDWAQLCETARAGLFTPPAETLDALNETLAALLHQDNLRVFLISSSASREVLLPALNAWTETLAAAPSIRQRPSRERRVEARLAARRGLAAPPVYVGLLNANTRNGTLLFTSRGAEPWDASRDNVLDALAGNVYAGGGGHGLFMRTWAAGLAYSNGYRYRERSGMASYYAERCPDVAETMRFITGVIESGTVDPALLRYALAVAFNSSRAAGPYEQRGEAMAEDLADGLGPDRVRAFREAQLAVAGEPGLADTLLARFPSIYGRVMVGLGEPLAKSPDGVFFLIGPEAQFTSLEALIAQTEAPTVVERLAPRDFWLVSSPPAGGS
ncbi:MAG: hypothetical protein R3C71_15060 [Candidatus Krumholzibacteriia bacterium]